MCRILFWRAVFWMARWIFPCYLTMHCKVSHSKCILLLWFSPTIVLLLLFKSCLLGLIGRTDELTVPLIRLHIALVFFCVCFFFLMALYSFFIYFIVEKLKYCVYWGSFSSFMMNEWFLGKKKCNRKWESLLCF